MSVNAGLAHVSTDFMIAALLIYSLALLAFAGDYAFGRPRRQAAKLAARPAVDRAAQLATVGRGARPAPALDGPESDASGIGRGAGARVERGGARRGRGSR